MAAAVPAALLLATDTERPRPPRFHRVCLRHNRRLVEEVVQMGHGHVEMLSCPGGPVSHRVHAWGVFDEHRGRVVAMGTESRIILMEGFDVPKSVFGAEVDDPEAYAAHVEQEHEKSGRPWMSAMAKLPPAPPRKPRTRTWPISVPKNVCAAPEEVEERSWVRLSDAELDAIKTEAWKPDADQVAIGRAHRVSATTVLKIKHGMVGH